MIRILSASFVTLAALLSTTAAARAHGDLHERIAAATKKIQKAPERSDLYLFRADLHREHRDWKAARADFAKARRLAPTAKSLDFCEGRMEFEAKQTTIALALFDRQLHKIPQHLPAHLYRARTLVLAGRPAESIRDFDFVLDQKKRAAPDHYLERARAQVVAKTDIAKTIAGIDQGVARLGPLVTLQLFALDLETRNGRWTEALRRIDRTLPTLPLQSPWLLRRGNALVRLGRIEEARTAYSNALLQIEAIPAVRRKAPVFRKLTLNVQTALKRLAHPEKLRGEK